MESGRVCVRGRGGRGGGRGNMSEEGEVTEEAIKVVVSEN